MITYGTCKELQITATQVVLLIKYDQKSHEQVVFFFTEIKIRHVTLFFLLLINIKKKK